MDWRYLPHHPWTTALAQNRVVNPHEVMFESDVRIALGDDERLSPRSMRTRPNVWCRNLIATFLKTMARLPVYNFATSR